MENLQLFSVFSEPLAPLQQRGAESSGDRGRGPVAGDCVKSVQCWTAPGSFPNSPSLQKK